jgi:hypothetical protein
MGSRGNERVPSLMMEASDERNHVGRYDEFREGPIDNPSDEVIVNITIPQRGGIIWMF